MISTILINLSDSGKCSKILHYAAKNLMKILIAL
jgi:hypothetical protein